MKTRLTLELLESRELLSQYNLVDLGSYSQPLALNQNGMAVGYDDNLDQSTSRPIAKRGWWLSFIAGPPSQVCRCI
jgi:hypothetical protein